MRKLICMMIALVMCLTIAAPAYATENGFVPSITYKPSPEIVPVVGEDGEEYIGIIRSKDGEIIDYVGHGCLLITPVADAMANKEDSRLPADAKSLLIDVYNKLEAKTMVLPESALKKAGLVGSGVEAKIVITEGEVEVNGVQELQRGKKLHDGDIVSYNGETIQIVK